MKQKTSVVKQLYRLNVEPRVVDRLATLAARTGEPRSRLAARLFTEAVLGYRPAARTEPGKRGTRAGNTPKPGKPAKPKSGKPPKPPKPA